MDGRLNKSKEMKIQILLLISASLFFIQCKTTSNMSRQSISDTIQLNKYEENAVFLGIKNVDILKINGAEFYHYFLIILIRNPNKINPRFENRVAQFYLSETKDSSEQEVIYFDSFVSRKNPLWETTISASSECGYDISKKKMGNLIKVPNYDRQNNLKSGKRVFAKKLVSNDLDCIEKILEFEDLYNDSLKYSLVPEINSQGYNSNSYFRGVMEYSGLMLDMEIPSCFRSPGITKAVVVE